MAIAVIMPKQGQSVETCIITRWFKKKGESVAAGDILFSYETDKAAFDLESPADGILLDIFFGEGAEVPVLENVAVIGSAGESASQFNPNQSAPADKAVPASVAAQEDKVPVKTEEKDYVTGADVSANAAGRIRISPRARKMAENKGIDVRAIKGTGPNGRIISADIANVPAAMMTAARAVAAGPGEADEQPLTNVRKLIAKAMHASLQNSAQLTHHMSANVSNILEARQKIKAEFSSGKSKYDITLNDMICWCVIRALEKFPEVNTHFLEDRIKTFHKVHLGIAVDTPRGLMVPAVPNASDLNLHALSAALKAAADASKKGNIDPELIQSTSASFTVSNLGNYGVEMFTPVINLPQTAILGVCTIINRPAVMGNNTFGFIPHIGLSLTYDHRAIDGGPATLFLKEIKEQIEAFRM